MIYYLQYITGSPNKHLTGLMTDFSSLFSLSVGSFPLRVLNSDFTIQK